MANSWRNAYGALETNQEVRATHGLPARSTSGHILGIIVVKLDYPKLPGNVANACTFPYPVLYKEVNFEIEQLFAGDPAIKDMVLDAARYLEAQGVRAIIGACGYFAHFQKDVANAVSVPVFMSSLCQLPLIKAGVRDDKKIAVFAADGTSLNDELLAQVGSDSSRLIVQNVGDMESFAPIRWGQLELDNGKLTDDLCALALSLCEKHPEIDAILLECSDLPPYAAAIQKATGLPVFDFITLANWVESAVIQRTYTGWF